MSIKNFLFIFVFIKDNHPQNCFFMGKAEKYLKKNWLKVAIVLLLVYGATRKNLSLKINMNTPVKTEEKQPIQPLAAPKEGYTDNQRIQPIETNTFSLDPFPTKQSASELAERLTKVDEVFKKEFIHRFVKVAVNEQHKFGIPASIILANALLMSQAGQSAAALGANNFFNLNCTSDWQGPTFTAGKTCLRNYETAWMSFRDHSYYITTGAFSPLRTKSTTDVKGWVGTLQTLGFYPTTADAKAVLLLIEQYELSSWDTR